MNSTAPRICKVFKWANGSVMVFDQHGHQMPQYQGRYEEVREQILANAADDVQFFDAVWGQPDSLKVLDSF